MTTPPIPALPSGSKQASVKTCRTGSTRSRTDRGLPQDVLCLSISKTKESSLSIDPQEYDSTYLDRILTNTVQPFPKIWFSATKAAPWVLQVHPCQNGHVPVARQWSRPIQSAWLQYYTLRQCHYEYQICPPRTFSQSTRNLHLFPPELPSPKVWRNTPQPSMNACKFHVPQWWENHQVARPMDTKEFHSNKPQCVWASTKCFFGRRLRRTNGLVMSLQLKNQNKKERCLLLLARQNCEINNHWFSRPHFFRGNGGFETKSKYKKKKHTYIYHILWASKKLE